LGLWLIDLGIDVTKLKNVGLQSLFRKICLANSRMRSWLAVEAMTKLTGKLSLPGSASGMIGNI